MAILCDQCGAQNPDFNRFCGQCGTKLATPPITEPPEEFWRDPSPSASKPIEASADLPPEVIDFDNQIPLFAGEGADRRVHPPAEVASELHDHLEREAEIHDFLQHGGEEHHDVLARENAPHETTEANSAHTGVSGPSFLGLSEDRAPVYLLEDIDPPSHTRRNIALVVLAAVVVLGAMQWRSMRDYGFAYIQNGSMRMTMPAKDAPRNPPAIAADNTGRDLGLPPATPKASEPKPLETSPNADHVLTSASTPAPTTPAPSQPAAMSAPAPDQPQPRVTPAPKPAKSPKVAVKPHPVAPTARKTPPEATSPGADEMRRAASASDAEARAAWLWRAVGKGNSQAPVELARMYERGSGVVKSCDQAQVLLRSAAAKGNEQARVDLQRIRARGGCASR
jgi:outer membrane biosynthesis protein TonB